MAVSADDVLDAAQRLSAVPLVQHTPLLESASLNALAGCRVLVKAECLQTPGSFKVRGATNRLLLLPEAQRRKGVVAFSSGNFGRGLAAAAQGLGVPCTIVMPEDAPLVKKQGARGFGAAVLESRVEAGVNREVTAAQTAEGVARDTGATLLHPFEDLHVIAGQGSAAVEAFADAAAAGVSPDVLVVPAGGGGLSAGCNLAKSRLAPGCRSYIVEPEHYGDHRASLAAGVRIRNPASAPPTRCDALQAVAPGVNTFPINLRHCNEGLTVTDAEVMHAVGVARSTLGLSLEPSGACPLAALLAGKIPGAVAGRAVVLLASGGDPACLPDPSLAARVGSSGVAKL